MGGVEGRWSGDVAYEEGGRRWRSCWADRRVWPKRWSMVWSRHDLSRPSGQRDVIAPSWTAAKNEQLSLSFCIFFQSTYFLLLFSLFSISSFLVTVPLISLSLFYPFFFLSIFFLVTVLLFFVYSSSFLFLFSMLRFPSLPISSPLRSVHSSFLMISF